MAGTKECLDFWSKTLVCDGKNAHGRLRGNFAFLCDTNEIEKLVVLNEISFTFIGNSKNQFNCLVLSDVV